MKRIGKFTGVTNRESALTLVDGGNITGDLSVAGASTFNGTITPGGGGIMAATPVLLATTNDDVSLTLAANGGRTNVVQNGIGASTVYILPTPTAGGEYYHFIYHHTDAQSNDFHIRTTTTNGSVIFNGSITHFDTTADENSGVAFTDGNSNDVLQVNNVGGLDLHFLSLNTTNWYVWGSVTSDTIPAFGDAV